MLEDVWVLKVFDYMNSLGRQRVILDYKRTFRKTVENLCLERNQIVKDSFIFVLVMLTGINALL
jgi:hypothetical protein